MTAPQESNSIQEQASAVVRRAAYHLGRLPTVRLRLMLLTTACMALAVSVVGTLYLLRAQQERTSAQLQVQRSAHECVEVIEQKVAAAAALLTGLSVSPALQSGDLTAFHQQASALQDSRHGFSGAWILLFEHGYQLPTDMVVNTRKPFGAEPGVSAPSSTTSAFVREVIATRQTQVSGLAGDYRVTVGIPITLNGEVVYVLAIVLKGAEAVPSFDKYSSQPGWITGVVDRVGKLLPGSQSPDHAIDRPPFDHELLKTAGAEDGVVDGLAPDGTPLYVAFSRSKMTGWTAFVATPKAALDSLIDRALLFVCGGGVLLLMVAMGIACVAGPGVTRPLRRRIVEDEERFETMANTVPSILLTTDPAGACDYANDRFYSFTGMAPQTTEGFRWADALHPEDRSRILAMLAERRKSGNGAAVEFRLRRRDGAYRWFASKTNAISDAKGRIVKRFSTATDIDDLKRTESALRQLSAQLMKTQDDERRRIARDIHDTTVQELVGAKIQIELVRTGAIPISDAAHVALDEASRLLRQSLEELRTLSYLLHPPMLDELGLASAVRWYVQGFEKRSGLRVSVVAPERMPRLPADIESALFRVVQEGLVNIHRHSGSAGARVVLKLNPDRIKVEIVDQGIGMPDAVSSESSGGQMQIGVGIPGMRLRLYQIGGTLKITSNTQGTTLRAIVPLEGNVLKASPLLTISAGGFQTEPKSTTRGEPSSEGRRRANVNEDDVAVGANHTRRTRPEERPMQ